MTAPMLLANLSSFGLQIAVLVAVAAALARVFRIDVPRALLTYWRVILLACLALPFLQPWTEVVVPPVGNAVAVAGEPLAVAESRAVIDVTRSSTPWFTADAWLLALGAGVAARALWLTLGAFALRRLRRRSIPLDPVPEPIRRAQARIGARARLYVSDHVAGPITFGLLKPIVVFPPTVSAMPAYVQEAIAYHELLHVRRRDWLYEVLEEAIRTVLWFHPAVWWLVGRIRLTREQVVDGLTIELTESKERYVEALLAVASTRSPAAFAPASAFLRRHLLKQRVARILQETTMTTRRLIASFAVSAAALTTAATFAVRSFPLAAQGRPQVDDGGPIQVVQGGEHLLHGSIPEYPHRAIEQRVEGDVVVDLTLDARGEVSDARVLSGPDELRRATLEAVLQWHFSPSAISSTMTQATLRFRLPPGNPKAATDSAAIEDFLEKVDMSEKVLSGKIAYAYALPDHHLGRLKELEKAMKDPAATDEQRAEYKAKYVEVRTMSDKIYADGEPVELKVFHADPLAGSPKLVHIRTERVPESTARDVLAQAGVAIGDVVTQESARRIREAARAIDEHFHVEFAKDTRGLVLTLLVR